VDERARQDFTAFVVARSPELIRLAYVLAGDQHAAEDLLQGALAKGSDKLIAGALAGSGGVPGSSSPACFRLAGAGMTITRVRSAQLTEPKPGDYVIFISLAPADRHRFAALSEKLVGLPAPRDQIAIVVGGQVIAHPVVTGVATSGIVQISGITSRTRAVTLLRDLRAG
jgi:hypothetical protein